MSVMADDGLIAGAAAPAGTRRIRSVATLDAIWVILVGIAVVVSSFFPLIDLPDSYLRTSDAPLRVWVVVLPVIALVVAVVALVRRSTLLAAVATGTLVPAVALCGSLGGALFFDAASPFTDAGAPLAVGAGVLGAMMLIRWFVYHPLSLVDVEPRPTIAASRGLLALGLVFVVNVVVDALADDVAWSMSFVVATSFMLLTPLVVVAAALVRKVNAQAVAGAACVAQLIAVVVARVTDDLEVGSTLSLRTGAVGLVALAVAAAVAGVGAATAAVDAEPDAPVEFDDDAAWRWTADDV